MFTRHRSATDRLWRDDRALRRPARLDRQTYWAMLAAGLAVTAALQAFGFRPNLGALTILMVMLQIRRARDFGGGGWWAAAYPLLVLCLLTRPADAAVSRAVLDLAIVGLVALFGAIPGDAGFNRFGPPPRSRPMFRRAQA